MKPGKDVIKKPRIAHILPWPTIGGVEQGTLRLARLSAQAGFHPIAFCREDGVLVRELFAGAGIETATYAPAEHSFRHFQPYWRASRALARSLREHRVDLVHCSDLLAGFYGGLAGRLVGKPVLCQVRCAFPHISLRDRIFLRTIHRFVFVSNDTRRNFGDIRGSRSGFVLQDSIDVPEVTPEAIDDGRAVRAELSIAPDAPVIGMVARVAPAKDFPTLAHAARGVLARYPRTRFLIVGDHDSREEYRRHYEEVCRLLDELGIRDAFLFTGHRPDVARLFPAMNVFVLCTQSEGFPLVLLEAMAQGLPVVATAVGGIPELITDASVGLLHPEGDRQALAAHLLDLLGNPAKASALARAGQTRIREYFGPARYIEDLTRIYLSALRG